jgi:hypothetical protein
MESMGQLNETGDGIESHFAVGIHEAEVSDFDESGWQHMLQKTPDEFDCLQGHGLQRWLPDFL